MPKVGSGLGRGHHLRGKPGPGRPKGSKNVLPKKPAADTNRTKQAQVYANAIIGRPKAIATMKQLADEGKLNPAIVTALLAYKFGRPITDEPPPPPAPNVTIIHKLRD